MSNIYFFTQVIGRAFKYQEKKFSFAQKKNSAVKEKNKCSALLRHQLTRPVPRDMILVPICVTFALKDTFFPFI